MKTFPTFGSKSKTLPVCGLYDRIEMNLQEKRNDMITKEFDTIAAISTPLGEGAIGIVRLSGTDSFKIAQKIFKGKD